MTSHVIVPQSGGRQPVMADVRWHPVANMSNYKIPGFALMMLKRRTAGSDFILQERDDKAGNAIWRVYKPDTEAEAAQDPYMLMINSEVPIAIGGRGRGTFDWPAQVLHDGGQDSLPNGRTCGPLAESWQVWSGRSAFVCQTHDITRAAPGSSNGIHTVWVAPNRKVVLPAAVGTGGSILLAADARVPLAVGSPSANVFTWGDASTGYGVKLSYPATVWVSFSATVSSETAAEGAALRLKLYVDDTPTYLTAWRKQGVDTTRADNAGYQWSVDFVTAENVATAGPLLLTAANQVLNIRNATGYVLEVADAVLSVFQMSHYIEAPAGGLHYP